MGIEIRMHTLNIDVARKHGTDCTLSTPIPLTSGGLTGGANTPYSLNTPDILNSLISITSNPFFENSSPTSCDSTQIGIGTNGNLPNGCSSGGGNHTCEDDRKVFATLEAACIGGGLTTTTPPLLPSPKSRTATVQSMRSQLIKDSLKLTIQSKRKSSGMCDLDFKTDESNTTKLRKREELTPEDEERRKRRRERNKVAATKCRNKKKEKTGLLMLESETLEGSNVSLKNEISKLELERRQLMEVLAAHEPVCNKQQQHQQQQQQQQQHNLPIPIPYRDFNRSGNIINNNINHSHLHPHHLHHHPNNNNHYFGAGPTTHTHLHLQSTTTQL